ncbi:membrane-bound lytic murein transglycosylase MltF [Gallionella capsiferriformans]|jgi:membrane-bound lytic murein transglycosylase F|uniref:Lytic transglycosylase catalytic n=1 Tax=Gallionella capsiferriformans (strain ES-2) TaxID=395494 RepID=D9SJ27_GALCS|nr:membrane-bound lytic murein transglycosylase MltF [Gallionella capsiferriformans]ADL54303.1 Lytic transglycosylase catalytic [Gallionella capsiferriformans ES-2]
MQRHKLIIRLFQISVFFALMLFGYTHLNKHIASWSDEELIVVIAQDSTLSDEEFSKQLAQQFADHLYVPLKIILVPADQISATLQKHQAHLSASGFRLDQKSSGLLLGPGFLTVREQVAFNQDQDAPKHLNDLIGKRIAVVAGSTHEKALIALKEQLPQLAWESRTMQTVEDLLKEVAQRSLDFTIANHEQISQMLNYYENLAVAFDIGKPSKLAWAFPHDADNELIAEAEQFFAEIEKNGELHKLLDRYYGHNDRLATLDAAEFIEQTNKTLPKFRTLFEKAGRIVNEDWRLIAAIAYQESHWDPLATSMTNVRGMMMLTEATADRMNVTNRLDARESINAGAKYLELIKKQLPPRIEEPERTWLALSAYNQGQGHLEDARTLTARKGGNADSWVEVKKWLPQLNNPVYFEKLKHGYARGGEAVIFVENIRAYYDMLTRLTDDTTPARDYQLVSTREKPAFSLHTPRKLKATAGGDKTEASYSLSDQRSIDGQHPPL